VRSKIQPEEEERERDESTQIFQKINWELIHQRLGIPGENRLKMMAKQMGLRTPLDGFQRLKAYETCIQAKS
jgi:hypothetical protein